MLTLTLMLMAADLGSPIPIDKQVAGLRADVDALKRDVAEMKGQPAAADPAPRPVVLPVYGLRLSPIGGLIVRFRAEAADEVAIRRAADLRLDGRPAAAADVAALAPAGMTVALRYGPPGTRDAGQMVGADFSTRAAVAASPPTWAGVRGRVAAGETVWIAVGVPGRPGDIELPAHPAVHPGRHKCYPGPDGSPVFECEDGQGSLAATRQRPAAAPVQWPTFASPFGGPPAGCPGGSCAAPAGPFGRRW